MAPITAIVLARRHGRLVALAGLMVALFAPASLPATAARAMSPEVAGSIPVTIQPVTQVVEVDAGQPATFVIEAPLCPWPSFDAGDGSYLAVWDATPGGATVFTHKYVYRSTPYTATASCAPGNSAAATVIVHRIPPIKLLPG